MNLTVDIKNFSNGHSILYKWIIDTRGYQDGFRIETCSLTTAVCENETSVYFETSVYERTLRHHTIRDDLVDAEKYLAVIYSYTQHLEVEGAQVAFTIGNYLPLLLVY